jgi:hypothetical protein
LKNARSNLSISGSEGRVNLFSIAPHKPELRLAARPIGRRPRIKMAAANRRCGPPEKLSFAEKYYRPVLTFFSVTAMKSRSVILRIEGEGFQLRK